MKILIRYRYRPDGTFEIEGNVLAHMLKLARESGRESSAKKAEKSEGAVR